jgi:hypothetical protein
MFSYLILELDLLGDRDAVLGDRSGEPKDFSMQDVASAVGPRVTLTVAGELADAVADALTRFLVVRDLLDCHDSLSCAG